MSADLPCREAQDRFIKLWGQMGSTWGIRRTMAEVHALLFITGRPLNTDEVMERLGISRGNASTALRALVDWGVVYREHQPGDRKDYFTAAGSIWDLARTVFEERRKRELDPTLSLLRQLLLNEPQDEQEAQAQEKIQEVYSLLELLEEFANTLSKLEHDDLLKLMKLGSGIVKLLEFKSKLTGGTSNSE